MHKLTVCAIFVAIAIVNSHRVQPSALGEAEKTNSHMHDVVANSQNMHGEMSNSSLPQQPKMEADTTSTKKKDGKCADVDENCFQFAQEGECAKNPTWMLENCKVSCHNCGDICQDSHQMCQDWYKNDECQRNPRYMHTHCAKSCGTCARVIANPLLANMPNDCEDYHTSCGVWAGKGECVANPTYMLANCKKACKVCKQKVPDFSNKISF